MDREQQPPQGKASLVHVLFLGCLILGIGLAAWALANIRAQPVQSADAEDRSTRTSSAETTVPSQEPTTPVEPTSRGVMPVPERSLYPDYPSEGDPIGTLSIPALGQAFPIIQGTRSSDLKKGVGHFVQSVLPGEQDNCVLSGHRDTHFSRLGELVIGDRLNVRTSAGYFSYEIRRIRIVDKDDRTVIVPTPQAVLTISTCYPFRYVGNAPDRYILVADLVPFAHARLIE